MRKQGLKQRAEGSQTLIVMIEKSWWYVRMWTAKGSVPVKFRELETLSWVGKEIGVRSGGVLGTP